MEFKELNKENIIKALEWCIQSEDCEYCEYNKGNIDVCSIRSDALAIIKAQDQKIFELENRLKECENGYEQTLHLERAKIKQLTEENEKYKREISELEREIEDLESTQEITPEAKYLVDTKADKIISLLTEFNKTQDELKTEVAREIFEEIETSMSMRGISTISLFALDVAKLKKKYIGEEKEYEKEQI